MSERNDKVLLIDMLESAEKVVRAMDGVTVDAFVKDDILRDATVFRLQVIGEAAYKVTDPLKAKWPEVDWFKIQGLRHRIVHDYRNIDDAQIHRITNKYVPPLVEQLKRIMEAGVE